MVNSPRSRSEWCYVCAQYHERPCPTHASIIAAVAEAPVESAAYPDNNPKTRFGMAKIPLHLVPPSAIHALARAFSDGAGKYGPFNWREKKISATVYYGAAMRHLTAWFDGEDLAPDSGRPHLDHALACIALLIDGQSVGMLNDNRPPKGAAAKMQADYSAPAPRPAAFCSDCGVDMEEQAHAATCLRFDRPPHDQVHP